MTDSVTARFHVYPNERAAARALARHVSDAIQVKPDLVLGLPTGRTPVGFYHELSGMVDHGRCSFRSVRTFNLDEFLGIPPTHPGSYRRFMEAHLFNRVDLPASQINFLNGDARDPEAECERYEQAIAQAGGLDVQILGIGTNGHIGFNEPGPRLEARTHLVTLKLESRRSNAALFGGQLDRVPTEALSMGMATILQAESLILLAHGESKAGCIAAVVHGPLTTELPASFLQLHHDVDLILDTGAASALTSEAQTVQR